MVVAFIPARYRNSTSEAVLNALRDVVDVEEVKSRLAHFDLSCGKRRPAWYREERPGDAFGATLMSGAVLAWSRFSPFEPLELFMWLDADRGCVVWREKV
ncbi:MULTISPECIES: hypothetical protein [Methylobacterium]|uniref:Uncharacterized protein n=2 Tax=Methylobacterium TaxID=407 RepID=A0A0C6F017_9HYPH|nr:hypothetical protein [Methylobacterium aquaticum]QRE77158.1 hypothetical protein F1D61_29720 [Methylobacterium aquaticum]BAQ45886.1 hypothetical protein Maq22A_c13345 [Methylobacterium aquaticum]